MFIRLGEELLDNETLSRNKPVAYLSANVYAIVKVRVFELARSRKHLLLYGVPFILWGSLILLGCNLMEIMRLTRCSQLKKTG